MKNPKNPIFTYIVAAVISVLGTLCATLICNSQFFLNSKYLFAVMILAVSTFVVCFVFRVEFNVLSDNHQKILRQSKEEAEAYKQQSAKLSQDNAAMSKQIAYYTGGQFQAEHKALQEKCETIESFRNSFPYHIADGYVIYNIIRTSMVAGSHSLWLFVGQLGEELWSCTVVRSATQSYGEMLHLAGMTKTPEDLTQLDQSKTTLWK